MSTDQMSGAGAGLAVLPPGLVPTPTPEYQAFRVEQGLATGVLQRRPLVLQPQPSSAEAVPTGTRVLIWKQDPGVGEIGIRKAFLPDQVLPGPRDTRIVITGLPPVSSNALGDFIVSPADAEAFDSVHTFAIVRQTLTMYQRNRGGAPLPWQWNGPTNTDPISVFPHAGVTANAFYDRNAKALKFFFFTKPGDPPTAPQIFTCRSLDIVAHETGHAVLDGLKPGWLGTGNPPQTGGLHESFGDLSAIFLALSQLDQVEAVVAQTKANLHDKSFLADLAEQFGAALGRPNGLRNADNDLKLSEVGNEVHALSQVFTGAIYDVLADIFAHERRVALKDDAAVLYQVGQYLAGLVVRAIIQSPPQGATFADVANRMRALVVVDKHPAYKAFITQQFTRREVLLAAEDGGTTRRCWQRWSTSRTRSRIGGGAAARCSWRRRARTRRRSTASTGGWPKPSAPSRPSGRARRTSASCRPSSGSGPARLTLASRPRCAEVGKLPA